MSKPLEKFFHVHGPLGNALSGYMPRQQQVEAAAAVNQAFERPGTVAIVEAGTGVGKTLAYLVPTLLNASKEKKVVISTHTLALQAQLWEKDIPLALSLQTKKQRAALLKGRGNYLCIQDMNSARTDLWTAGDPAFAEILEWSGETETGDLAELPFNFPEWSEISANPDTCRGAECRYFEDCFYYKAKRQAEDAAVVLVNHALYFSDLALRHTDADAGLLPEHSFVVFDEAHHLENAASRAFGISITSSRVGALIKRLKRLGTRLELDDDRLRTLERETGELFEAFCDSGRSEFEVTEVMPDLTWAQSKTSVIASVLENLSTALGKIDTTEDRQLRERIEGLVRQTTRLSDELSALFNHVDRNYVRWGTFMLLRDRSPFVTLNWTPISVSSQLNDALWVTKEISAALISATLSTNDGFVFLKERLGLTGVSGDEETAGLRSKTAETDCIELIADSPFDYAKNCRLYIPDGLRDPNDSMDYTTQIVSEIQDLVYASNGGAFLLFTSHRMLQQVYSLILEARMPYPLFRQGEMPASRLLTEFRNSSNGVLFGTQSFWEGVDVPGDSLRLVVVDKLPFGSPDSPMHKARVNAITRAGGDWFNDLVLPQAQLKLKQGFGRLIRNSTDRGVVAILDNRLISKSYGRKFLMYLPRAGRVSDIEAVRRFYLTDSRTG